MIDFIMKYWLEVAFGLLLPFCGVLAKSFQARVKEQESIKEGLKALLRNEIIDKYNHYMEKGYCPIYARENLRGMYQGYVGLKGNGIVPGLMEDLEELPTQKQKRGQEDERTYGKV